MKLKQYYLTENDCYRTGKKHKVKGLMIHSTGVNNVYLKRYVGPDDGVLGVNRYNNHWNAPGISKCVHGFIGKDKNGTIRTYQTLPWDMAGWHSGSGSLGYKKNANNTGFIGVEICEDDTKGENYFNLVYREAIELFAYLCKKYKLDPLKDVICHSEGHVQGIASNHADVMHWFPKHGKSMDTFRADIKSLLDADTVTTTAQAKPKKYYRIQVGVFSSKLYANKLLAKLKKAGFDDAYIKYE